MASVWGVPQGSQESQGSVGNETALQSPLVVFADVMSEELAHSFAQSPNRTLHAHSNIANPTTKSLVDARLVEDALSSSPIQCQSDELLAKILQKEFDREHDHFVNKAQEKANGSSRVSLSFDKYRRVKKASDEQQHISDSDSEDNDDYDDDEDRKPWDAYEKDEKSPALKVGRSGFVRNQDGSMTTKHDAEICGRANARRVMDRADAVSMGDGAGMDLKLNNRDYNVLRAYSNKQSKRAARLHEKREKSTAEGVMDAKTKLLLFKLVNSEYLDEVNGCINTGKEANVYHGLGGNVEEMVIPGEVAIKVFKTTLSEFKHRDPYIKDDFRFTDRFCSQNPRKMIHLWAEKEKHNLVRLRRAGIPCPEVVLLKKHILIMQFLGKDAKGSPTLKEAKLEEHDLSKAYNQTVQIMMKMYSKCDLIHADLSEYNLLWHEQAVWVIDVSQSVLRAHPYAAKFLYRDCCNISSYFNKRGLAEVLSAEQLFHTITGKSVLNEQGEFSLELLEKLGDFEKDLELLTIGEPEKVDPFEEMLTKSLQEREGRQQSSETSRRPVPSASQPLKQRVTHDSKLAKSPPKSQHHNKDAGGGPNRQ